VIFAVGAAVGSAVTWKLVKDKYEKLAQEEIDSVKEVFSKRKSETESQDETEEPETGKDVMSKDSTIVEYADLLRKQGYNNNLNKKGKEKESDEMKEPYVITPDEFVDGEEYEKITLIYYADNVLADEDDDLVNNVEDIIGDALSHFGEYEEDAVYVRNEQLRAEYEILKDLRTYAEVCGYNVYGSDLEGK
jgi:methyl coenzyme M reductase gamma subunit